MASGFTTLTNEHLIRTDIWSREIQTLLLDDLIAMRWVRIISDFPDGTTIHFPSIGAAEIATFVEGQTVKYNKMDTGTFPFTFTQYMYSANSISEKFKRDSFYAAEVLSQFSPAQHRALMEGIETRVLAVGNSGQTASDPNTINTAAHRWVAKGASNSMSFKDFFLAQYALMKANVPLNNLVAIVDPSVAFTLQNNANITNLLTPHPKWNQITNDGLVTGFKFQFNIAGFDVYMSNYLPKSISETVSATAVTNGVANYFFSATPGQTLPWIGGFRQMPTVHSRFDMETQEWKYMTITEYDFKLKRPDNFITVLSDTTVVS